MKVVGADDVYFKHREQDVWTSQASINVKILRIGYVIYTNSFPSSFQCINNHTDW